MFLGVGDLGRLARLAPAWDVMVRVELGLPPSMEASGRRGEVPKLPFLHGKACDITLRALRWPH